MELAEHIAPFEMKRLFSLFFKNAVVDFDLRFPESRSRRYLEIKLFAEEDYKMADPIIEDLAKTSRQISYFEWPLLFEWNERWQQERLRIRLHYALQNSRAREVAATSAVMRVVLQRLGQIEQTVRSNRLEPRPGFTELIQFRWKFAGLRDEAHYLLDRYESLKR